ncbi:MAG: MBL-fold metallo-hydrolase superfamily [Ktedonobacterales bacterium]|jgi:glyoxylase-like metal-dependent hydrolase (beta-lactamase superfamily II)|nr:MAG: MBL-fold metallo-hydrolase superfamily [Ktedonobacterales bacterium]
MGLPNGVELILAPNPSLLTGPGTNTYLIAAGEGHGGCVVIDPGPEDAGHLTKIAEMAEARGGLNAILITHGHPDHVEGAARLRELTGAPVLAWSRAGSPQADALLADEQVFLIGGRQVRALHTPGHRFDHLCFLLEDAGALFAGDLVAGVGTVVIAPPEGDLAEYMASLRRLLALELRVILPAHGPQIDEPRTLLEQYIAHRNEREAQVLAGLAAGPVTVDALVASIYADVDPRLHPMAALSLTAHLLKLEREGRVAREADATGTERWRLA